MSRNPATLLATVFVVVASSASTLVAQYPPPCVSTGFTIGSTSPYNAYEIFVSNGNFSEYYS